MSKKLKVFRLSLKKWLRGNSDNFTEACGSALRDEDTGTYCCLGMFGVQCGISRRRLTGKDTPSELADTAKKAATLPADYQKLVSVYKNGKVKDSRTACLAVAINDDEKTDDAQKIKALRPIFRKLGYRIEVVP